MNEFLEENYSYLVTMTSIIYCMLGFVLIFFNTPPKNQHLCTLSKVKEITGYWHVHNEYRYMDLACQLQRSVDILIRLGGEFRYHPILSRRYLLLLFLQ